MGNDDARSLDSQDTGGFAHPRGGQRAGGRKPLGCRAHFGCYRTDNVWLAGALPARRLGRFEGQTVIRPSAEVERARDAMDLRHGDAEEPVAAAIFVRIVDARDGGDADQKKIQHRAGRQFRWPVVGADRHHLSEATASRDRTRRVSGSAMAQERIPEDQGDGQKTRGGHLFRRRGAHPLRSSRGADMGGERRHAHRPSDGRSPWHESDFGGHLARPPAVHDHRQGQRQRRCLHRIPETPDQGRRAQNLFDRRSWLGSSCEESQRFRANAGAKLCLFFLPPYAPDRNPDELVWKHLKADTVGRMAVTSKEDFAKKVRRSMRDLQNDARKIISFFQKPSREYEPTYGRIIQSSAAPFCPRVYHPRTGRAPSRLIIRCPLNRRKVTPGLRAKSRDSMCGHSYLRRACRARRGLSAYADLP